jgi:hypothetical protein
MTSNKAVYHKNYKESTLKNDIAIIFLPKPIDETSNAKAPQKFSYSNPDL